ncbi:hypothetical protein [Borreliella turdi]|nr:hypothetical protein [Borreliella turdi]
MFRLTLPIGVHDMQIEVNIVVIMLRLMILNKFDIKNLISTFCFWT